MVLETQFTSQWHDAQQSILLITFPRYFDITELLREAEHITAMVDESNAVRIDLVLILNGSQISGGSDLLTLLHGLTMRVPDAVQSVIHVNASTFTYMMTRNIAMLNRRYRTLMHYVDTLEQALVRVEALRRDS